MKLFVLCILAFACAVVEGYASGSAYNSGATPTPTPSKSPPSPPGPSLSGRRRAFQYVYQTVTLSSASTPTPSPSPAAGIKSASDYSTRNSGKLKQLVEWGWGKALGLWNKTGAPGNKPGFQCSPKSSLDKGACATVTSTASRRDVNVKLTAKVPTQEAQSLSLYTSAKSSATSLTKTSLQNAMNSVRTTMVQAYPADANKWKAVTIPAVTTVKQPSTWWPDISIAGKAFASWIIAVIVISVVLCCICPIIIFCCCVGGVACCAGAAASSASQAGQV